jgi:hypothetical protein
MGYEDQHPCVTELQIAAANQLYEAACNLNYEQMRPSYLYRPRLSIDGDQWRALYGENLQDGVAGFGGSPGEAYAAFDKAWTEGLPIAAIPGAAREGEEED